MKAIVILVESQGEENIGFIARAMKNFGLNELILVSPKANHLSGTTKSRAMHAVDILKKATVVKSLKKALKQVDFAVATTSKTTKNEKLFRTALSAKKFAEKFSGSKGIYGLVFGTESIGLSNEQIKQCDFIVSIPASHKYRSMNLSHAATILFYELFQSKSQKKFSTMSKQKKKLLEKEFLKMLAKAKKIQNQESIKLSIKAFLSKSLLSEKEANALLSLLKSKKE